MLHSLLMIAICLAGMSCRVSDPPVLKENSTTLLYDGFASGQFGEDTPALVREAFSTQNSELAEPVAVVSWEPEQHSQWEVFFATNRGEEKLSVQERTTYGNEVLLSPQYGRAVVQVPSRQRGEDPCLEMPTHTWGIIPIKRSLQKRSIVEFPRVESLETQEFMEGVSRQIAQSRDKDLLLFVHGFNVDFEAAVLRTAQLGWDLPFNGALVSYAWPTQGGVKNYERDEPINLASVVPFTEFLRNLMASVPSGTRINIIVHSMGNRIVMQALDQLPRADSGHKPICQLALCAPDVGVSDYRRWISGCLAQCEHVTLYANVGDSALISSKSLHVEQRAGDADPPVVVEQVETIDCSAIELNLMGHCYYGSNPDVLTDLFMLIKQNRMAGERSHLKQKTTAQGEPYFVFENHSPKLFYTWNFENILPRTLSSDQLIKSGVDVNSHIQ